MRRLASTEAWLVIGMSIAIAGSAVVAVAPSETTILVRRAMLMAALLLMAVAYVTVANRVGGWRRHVLWLVAVLQLGWVGWSIARPFVVEHIGEAWFLEIGYRLISATLWWSGIVLLTVAARAWWRPATPWVVVAAVLVVMLEALPWAPYLAPAFDGSVANYPAVEPWIRPLRELLASGAILVLVRSILGDLPDHDEGRRSRQ